MTDTHTPGPWRVDFGETTSVRLSDGCRVATLNYLRFYSRAAASEVAANARLIAAAPELLAALEALLDCEPALLSAKERRAYATARDAIIKATGGQS